VSALREIASALHPDRSAERRVFLIFRFYCDESHDSPPTKKTECKSYVVGGMFGDEQSWNKVERGWSRKNSLEGVGRFHAAHLNAGTWEYDGWSKPRRDRYSKEILKILKIQSRKLHGIGIGLYVDEYRKIISAEGQEKLGHPYLVCFKTAMTTVASQMDRIGSGFQRDDRVAVIIDRNEFETEAVRLFYAMKDDPGFKHRHRLATCTPSSSEEVVALQVADFVAYESFKLMHGKRTHADFDMRPSMKAVLHSIGFMGFALGTESLNRMKDDVDRLPSAPNGFFIISPFDGKEDGKSAPTT
jgi:Protein of unknown function (DUF3800)